ncbi:MAG: transcription antitermination factor NusB [Alphaproteobacteria bacterium]
MSDAAPSTERGGSGQPARKAALGILRDVLDKRRPLEDVLDHGAHAGALDALDLRDRGFALALVRATLRHLGRIDALLAEFLSEDLPARSGPAKHILRLGAADLLLLETPAHAAVNSAVELATRDKSARHFRGLINAVLRRVGDRAAEFRTADAAAGLFPDWLMASWSRAYGDERAQAIARAHVGEPAVDLTLRPGLDAGQWAERLNARLLPTGTLRLPEDHARIPDLPGFAEGAWWVQDAAAALPARLLGDIRGRRILDLCAAPGGKTAWLAASGALVAAVEKSEGRAARLKENLARLKLEAEIVIADARDFHGGAPFDAALLDAPCTSTGTIRRHPDIPWIKEADDVRALSLLQDELISHAFGLLKPGGHLVYSVCSLEPQEGEEAIARFLAATPGAVRMPVARDEIPGLTPFVTPDGDVRTTPADWPEWGGLDGFFAARITRA